MKTQLLLEVGLITTMLLIMAITLYRSRDKQTSKAAGFSRIISGLLGGFLLMAGTVKFFDPFTSMFTQQIALSGLPFPWLSRWAGQLGEMSAGIGFLVVIIMGKQMGKPLTQKVFYGASLLTMIIMSVAIFVHLNPDVPAEVLPLQSKPPVMTLIIMAIVTINAYLFRSGRTKKLKLG